MKNSSKKKQYIYIAGILLAILIVCVIRLNFLPKGEEDRAKESTTININDMKLEMELIAYRHAMLNFTEVETEEVNFKIQNNEQFFLYVGRPTCQWCRRIVPALSSVVKSNSIEMYYLDSQDTEVDTILSDFRKKYGIETVPAIVYFINEKEHYMFELDLTEENMENMAKNIYEQYQKALQVHITDD